MAKEGISTIYQAFYVSGGCQFLYNYLGRQACVFAVIELSEGLQ